MRRFTKSLLLIAASLSLFFFFFQHRVSIFSGRFPAILPTVSRHPANATLGFGAIYAVSGPGSPRRAHLLEAAAVTEINITVPEQPVWQEEDIRGFQIPNYEESTLGSGSIRAWLSHHVVLKEFLKSGLETALILEDDVDWDIRLRTKQIPMAQSAARSLLKAPSWTKSAYPWGSPNSWDLLYLGHCGDYFGNLEDGFEDHYPAQLEQVHHVLYSDPTLLPYSDLHPFTSELLQAFDVPEKARVFHRSQWPLCTFGYAIHRRSAELLLTEIAPAKEDPERKLTAYDAAILTACRDGAFRCYTLQPELLHHMEGESLISIAEQDPNKPRPPVDAAGEEQVLRRGETSNIGCGFWSGDFYYNGDESKLQRLILEVGRKGQCLKENPGLSGKQHD